MAAEKVVCDTDVMIDYWDAGKSRHAETKTILEKDIGLDNVVLSAITKMELMAGATNKVDLAKIHKKPERFNMALLNSDITLKSFELLSRYLLSHGLSIPDSMIGSTAIVADLELFSYNVKDYIFIPELRLFKR